jgi:DNA helicase IV
MPHPELAAEQAYVDNAYAQLEKMRETLAGAQDRMATEFAAVAMEAWLKRRHTTFQDAERGLCFGRLTLDATLRPLYVGRRWVHDDAHEALVVNWQAPAARPFYTATPSEPQRVTQRRRFRTEGRRLVDISDESLDG